MHRTGQNLRLTEIDLHGQSGQNDLRGKKLRKGIIVKTVKKVRMLLAKA
jgi:hypothetical protein